MVQSLLVRPFTDEEQRQLTAQTASPNKDEARRAQLLLLSAERKTSAQIADHLDFHPSNVKKWIRKFNESGIDGIEVRKRGPRHGPRPSFSRDQVQRLLELASTDPSSLGLDFQKWTAQKLAKAVVDRGIAERISHVTVQKILNRNQARVQSSRRYNDTVSVVSQAEAPKFGNDGSNLALGRVALSQYKFSVAVQLLDQALSQDPLGSEEEAEIRSLLSQALEELGRDQEAYRAVEKYQDAKVVRSLPDRCRARVKLRLGWAYSWLRNHPSAIASLNEARKLFLELKDQGAVCETLLAMGRTYIELREPRIARDHLLEILKLRQSTDDHELMARTYTRLGNVDFYEGAFKSSNEHYLKALKLAEACANPNVIGLVLLNLGISSYYDDPGERGKAANYRRRAIECLSERGHKGYLVLAYNNLGEILRISGEWAEALALLDTAIEIALRFDQPSHEAAGRQTKAELLLAMGRYDEAEEHVNRCIQLAEKDSDKWLESSAVRILGGIHLGRGLLDTALASLRHAVHLSTSVRDLSGAALAEVGLAECHIQQGAYQQATEYLDLAHDRLKEEKSRSLLFSGMLQRLHGQVQGASGHFSEAKNHLNQSLSVFTTTAMPYELARTHHAMGLLLRAAGDPKGAQSHLADACNVFKSLGAVPGVEQTTRALAEVPYNGQGAPFSPSPVEHPISVLAEQSLRQYHPDFQAAVAQHSAQLVHNDVALMQRLIEASASRDVLLQELASIVYDSFSAEVVMVCRVTNSGEAEPLASEGITGSEADRLCRNIDLPSRESDGIRNGAYIGYIDSVRDTSSRYPDAPASLFLYVTPSAQISPDRLYPLIRQVELGLETCLLRASSTAVSPAAFESRTRVVMPGFIVGSASMFDVIDKIHKIRTSDVNVLITGESGTGKELVARAIHAESARARAIFLPFNCTATPRDLIESQLFGHRRGAFTGATGNYPGMVRAAEGGTLFLDEIGDLALEVQPKLMRFLQESEIQPLGETKPQRVDVRIIAATNSDLERAVEDGRFREDLFHRLNIIRIHVPPLRERREEVPALASFFLDHFATRSGNHGLTFSHDAVDALTGYDWPGNIRQLRNEIERATAYTSGAALITADDLSPEVRGGVKRHGGARRLDRSVESRHNGHGRDGRPGHKPSNSWPDEEQGQSGPLKLKDAIADVEARLIRQALSRNKNNLSQAAIDLGLSRRGLRLKLAQLGIERV